MINQDESSQDVIKPLAVGKDVKRYHIASENKYLIFTRRGVNIEDYPAIRSHLQKFKDELEPEPPSNTGSWEGRKSGEYEWYEIQDTIDYWEDFELNKIVYPSISKKPRFVLDTDGYYLNNKCFIISEENWALVGLLNSTAAHFWLDDKLPTLRGGYYETRSEILRSFPIPNGISSVKQNLDSRVREVTGYIERKTNLNTDLLDHLGNIRYLANISDFGLIQPPTSSASSILRKTAKEHPKLRIGTIRVDRKSPNTVLIEATARYKPDDGEAHETDQWGYTETEYLPAFRITDLTEREADLIEHFVPVAVDEAGGFANFRETATKTNSLIDRLKAIELPDVDDVADNLENYLETKERAEELDKKIKQTDQLIDEIVYELYGLTDEEIEIVEEAVEK